MAKAKSQSHDTNGKFAKGNKCGPHTGGKPGRVFSLRRITREKLQEQSKGRGKKLVAERVVDALIVKSLDKNDRDQLKAIQLLYEHVDGKPKQSVEIDAKVKPTALDSLGESTLGDLQKMRAELAAKVEKVTPKKKKKVKKTKKGRD